MREIAYQLAQQTGTSSLLSKADHDNPDADEDVSPFLDGETTISLPPSSHLPHLISVLPTLTRSTVVILEGFDLFALHPRQSLLYCLLDTVQSCRAAHGNKGIAVIGITTRVDTINLLEKRVKSRFSGRILRTAPPRRFESWIGVARNALCVPIDGTPSAEWSEVWLSAVDDFLADPRVRSIMNETFALTRDIRTLSRILVGSVYCCEVFF
jgi:origin recognition complex subunit 4